jgi:3',5'-cyclic-AMP phosphodiesterase
MTSTRTDQPAREQKARDRVLAFAHIGDLHITDARQRNFQDFLAIVAQIEIECGELLDFVVLPGDNADNGLGSQYALVATGLKMLSGPVHVIPGDHDMEQGGLDAFYDGLASATLPRAETLRGFRCLFLDISGPGKGGPDFRLGAEQTSWVEQELQTARAQGETVVVFMHSYPDDLKGDGEARAFNDLIAAHDVALVDMGHTHYNELANDGRTIFAATRSTGQIVEGPVGYSIATIDQGIVSWRFKALDDPCPFVVITAPADHRLMRHPGQAIDGSCEVRALVFGAKPVKSVACLVADVWTTMTPAPGGRIWTASVPMADERLAAITVEAVDESGRPGRHTIQAPTGRFVRPARPRNGSDAATIGAWPENGIFGTQLGPNRNAKPILR